MAKNGLTPKQPGSDDINPRIVSIEVSYGDLTGDNECEAAVLLGWRAGGNGYFTKVLVYSIEDHSVLILGEVQGGDRSLGGLESARIVGGRLLVDRERGGPCAACPGPVVTEIYRFTSGKLELETETTDG